MVNVLDDNLANMTTLLQQKGMWENTLMVLTSDNGGYVKSFDGTCDPDTPNGYACFNGEAGANNWSVSRVRVQESCKAAVGNRSGKGESG